MKKIIFVTLLTFLHVALIAQVNKEIIYVGTYTVRGSEGIYVFEFDRSKGTLNLIQTVPELKNPSFLDIHPNGKFLYSVSEADNSGAASAFSIDSRTGRLTFINLKPSQGKGSCHISIDQKGKLAFVSNYGEGNFVVLPLKPDGSLQDASDSVRHTGRSINKNRQEKPHVHSGILSPDNRFVYVSDLGTDKIYIYEIDYRKGKIKPAKSPYVQVTAGSGPRHFTFHPNGKYAYSAEELTSSVATLSLDKASGGLAIIEDTVRSLPADFAGTNTSADIHLNVSGDFLYLSNRGLNALSVFSVNKDGKLKLLANQKTFGEKPRNFMIDDQGKYVFVANQDTDNIVVFEINNKTGMLTKVSETAVPSPVCIKKVMLK